MVAPAPVLTDDSLLVAPAPELTDENILVAPAPVLTDDNLSIAPASVWSLSAWPGTNDRDPGFLEHSALAVQGSWPLSPQYYPDSLQSVSWSLAEFRHNKIVQSPHENYFKVCRQHKEK